MKRLRDVGHFISPKHCILTSSETDTKTNLGVQDNLGVQVNIRGGVLPWWSSG